MRRRRGRYAGRDPVPLSALMQLWEPLPAAGGDVLEQLEGALEVERVGELFNRAEGDVSIPPALDLGDEADAHLRPGGELRLGELAILSPVLQPDSERHAGNDKAPPR